MAARQQFQRNCEAVASESDDREQVCPCRVVCLHEFLLHGIPDISRFTFLTSNSGFRRGMRTPAPSFENCVNVGLQADTRWSISPSREYLQKPGHRSSERAKARRQLFLLPPLPEFAEGEQRQKPAETPAKQQKTTSDLVLEEPLPVPRRLVWLRFEER